MTRLSKKTDFGQNVSVHYNYGTEKEGIPSFAIEIWQNMVKQLR